jgi:hypothetical protein
MHNRAGNDGNLTISRDGVGSEGLLAPFRSPSADRAGRVRGPKFYEILLHMTPPGRCLRAFGILAAKDGRRLRLPTTLPECKTTAPLREQTNCEAAAMGTAKAAHEATSALAHGS